MAGHGFLIDRVTTCLCRRWAAALPDGHRRRRGRLRAVHLHPGGQGFWIARLVAVLGIEARLVSPIGGEAGDVLQALVPQWEVELHALPASITSPTRVHDRRSGERLEILEVEEPTLDRHDANDLYSITLETALTSAAVVLTAASGGLLDAEAYRRLVTDLNAQQIPIFADLHDDPLAAALEGGRLDLLKVSEEDLRDDGWAMGSEKQSIDATRELVSRGADMVQSVIHSGTVGAALTALTFGAHGLAVSLDPSDPWHWDTAAQLAVATAGWIMSAERQPLTLSTRRACRSTRCWGCGWPNWMVSATSGWPRPTRAARSSSWRCRVKARSLRPKVRTLGCCASATPRSPCSGICSGLAASCLVTLAGSGNPQWISPSRGRIDAGPR